MVGSLVEELLRYESPVQHTARTAPADMQLGEKAKEGRGRRRFWRRRIAIPIDFPGSNRLDLLRSNNRHLAFRWTAHFCSARRWRGW